MVSKDIDFLGNTISENNINELQSWLGVANYLRKYIEKYAEIVQPLYDIMDLKNVPNH
jgi:hypothetical protein